MPDRRLGAVVLVALLVGSVVGAGATTLLTPDSVDRSHGDPIPNEPVDDETQEAGVSQFADAAAFEEYVRRGRADTGGYHFVTGNVALTRTETAVMETTDSAAARSGGDGDAGRHSSTNVQEAGIDEPDLLKTTGDVLYYATQQPYFAEPTVREDDRQSRPAPGKTHVFDTTDPAAPTEIAGIEGSGKLLLSGDRLVVFQGNRLVGYDVSDPTNPAQTWNRSINGSVETARLADGTVYLVTASSVSPGTPCPIRPLGGPDAAVECTDIYHPQRQISVDVTYTAYAISPETGAVEDSVSAVGTWDRSAVYMSENALYLTYTERTPHGEIRMDALLSDDIEVPSWVENRLREVRSYNLSAAAQNAEVRATIRQWLSGLDADERRQVQSTLSEAVSSYVREHRRDLVTTGVVRIGVDDGLDVESVGEVPGEPLNQFSMDEHDGTLRIATTIPRQHGTDSVNDLYTLDAESLERTGSVQGMGVDERVYAVRYVGETAYVVTFRRVDPFHVVDLSDPENPEEVGTLKLPGYSSYLHPVDENHVLGIGEEDGEVKTVLFDVSDPSNPTIDDTYFPEARWSAISESHHAFLLDRKHGVFFLPAGESGYVVEYTGSELSLEKRVPMSGQTRRAAYIDDYLYVFGNEELAVVDETDWTVETRRSLD